MRRVALLLCCVVVATTACVTSPLPDPSTGPPSGPSPGCTTDAVPRIDDANPRPQTLTLEWGGRTRRAILVVPTDYQRTDPAPLLISLHPFVLNPEQWEEYSGLGDRAVERGYVVVSPEGSAPGPRWAVPGGLDTGVDDLGFIAALIDDISASLCIDGSRIFAAGYSAGAAMAEALGCVYPDRIAAIVGSGGTNLTTLCPDAPGVDTLIMHGSADPIAPTSGSYVVFAPPIGLPVKRVVETAAHRSGCAPTFTREQRTATVQVDRYTGCTDGRRVEFWLERGAGHTWAGVQGPGAQLGSLVVGPTDLSIDATAVTLEFFDTGRSGRGLGVAFAHPGARCEDDLPSCR